MVWFQQIHQPDGSFPLPPHEESLDADCQLFLVTPGNRAAAVVAGFNVIVFSTIAILAHREKLQKKRNNQLAVDSSESVLQVDEKKTAQVQEVKV